MKTILNRIKKIGIKISFIYGYIMAMIVTSTNNVFANDLVNNDIVDGGKELLQDGAKVLTIFIPLIGILVLIYQAIKLINADMNEQGLIKKRMLQVFIGMIIGISASLIITIITGYFQ